MEKEDRYKFWKALAIIFIIISIIFIWISSNPCSSNNPVEETIINYCKRDCLSLSYHSSYIDKDGYCICALPEFENMYNKVLIAGNNNVYDYETEKYIFNLYDKKEEVS